MTPARRLIRLKTRMTARKDILNATFTLLPEYRNGLAAAVAAFGHSHDAVEDLDAFTELRKLVWRHR